jgi:hypothetical protein
LEQVLRALGHRDREMTHEAAKALFKVLDENKDGQLSRDGQSDNGAAAGGASEQPTGEQYTQPRHARVVRSAHSVRIYLIFCSLFFFVSEFLSLAENEHAFSMNAPYHSVAAHFGLLLQ